MHRDIDHTRDQEDYRKEMHKTIDRKRDHTTGRKAYHRIIEENRRKNPIRQAYIKQWKNQKTVSTIPYDTGFNLKCASCLQFKSITACQRVENLTDDDLDNYITMNELTKSKDGNFYCCYYCKSEIRNNRREKQGNRSMELLDNIPQSLEQKLKNVCKYKDMILCNKERFGETGLSTKTLMPNKLESFLLKLVIPFIRVGHCPRGRYLQLRGNIILISADVPESMEKILPQEQALFPVSFKRKLAYEGHYLSEIIDRNKVVTWFKWLKRNNPHFTDTTFESELIDDFCQQSRETADSFEEICEPTITLPEDEIEKEEIEEVPISKQYPSMMIN